MSDIPSGDNLKRAVMVAVAALWIACFFHTLPLLN